MLTIGFLMASAGALFGQVLLYVPTNSSQQLWEYGVTSGTGALTNFPTQTTTSQPAVVATTPNNRFMYVGEYSGNIDAFVVNYDGTLTVVPPPIVNAGNVRGLATDASGKFLYAADGTGNTIVTFSINQTTGALTAVGSPVSLGAATGPRGVLTDNSGHLYVALAGAGAVAQYSINATTGALTQIAAPIAAGTNTERLAASGSFLYATNSFGGGTVTPFTISGTGVLVANGAPVSLGLGAAAFGVTVNGQFLIVTNNAVNSANVNVFSIGGGGLLTQVSGSPFSAGVSPAGVTVDPSGNFVYVANSGGSNITKFTMNTSTGALTAPSTFATGGTPLFLISRSAPVNNAPVNNSVPASSTWSLAGLGMLLAGSSALLYRRAYR